ncbi:helix-turn-helix transcriptional regulator [Sphaerisporangium aureirubrum]|uniref:Helix-turn-helix transcriptional regulator n=1 Tax=Sphaerisporangium aureirubrum TaxID=1544736 RepID=A0ABW1NTD2_9ACTN
MANTSSRTLRLLSLLQTYRYWPGAELADRLGVSARTLRRDVDRLRELGYPVKANRGVEGGYQLGAGAVLPPLLVDDEEAVALAIGLRVAAQGAVAGIGEASVRALTKVVQVMPPRLRRQVEALRTATVTTMWSGGPTVDATILTTVAQTCRDEERLRFAYEARDGERTDRYVEPHRLVPIGRRWYLVAYDLTRHDWRSFRLDRLTDPSATRERYRPRELPAEDAAEFVRRGIGALTAPVHAVEVIVHTSAATARRSTANWATVEEIDDTRCRMTMNVENLHWPAMLLGTIGAEFEVLSPPELVEHLREWSTRFARSTA